MNIFYITPYTSERNKLGFPNIGKSINETIKHLPYDCWVVLRDGDTMFLTSDWGCKIEEIIKDNMNSYDLITCVTNRLGVKEQLINGQFMEGDISHQIEVAKTSWQDHGTTVIPTRLAAGLCMIFRKSLWQKVGGFPEFDITFDRVFSQKVIKSGGKIGIARGLYIFHLYRYQEENPQNSIKHLTR